MARKSAIDKVTVPVTSLSAIRDRLQKRASTVKETSLILDDGVFEAMYAAITNGGSNFEDFAADLRDVARTAKMGSDSALSTITARDIEAAYRVEEKRRRREHLSPFVQRPATNAAPPAVPKPPDGVQDNGASGGGVEVQKPPGAESTNVVPIRRRRTGPGADGGTGGAGKTGDGSQMSDVAQL